MLASGAWKNVGKTWKKPGKTRGKGGENTESHGKKKGKTKGGDARLGPARDSQQFLKNCGIWGIWGLSQVRLPLQIPQGKKGRIPGKIWEKKPPGFPVPPRPGVTGENGREKKT